MIWFRLISVLILVTFASNSAWAQKITKETFLFEGKKRTYYFYVPASVKPESAAPLLVLFHGSNRNGLTLVEKWKSLADQENVILLGPDSADLSRWSIPVDGPLFVYQLVESIKSKYAISPRRVYLFGHSGGAIFALMLSMYESEYFAGAAAHAGALHGEAANLIEFGKRKIPIYLVVGSRDPLFPIPLVRATRDALEARGFPVTLIEIQGHDHWYYDRAPQINQGAWEFLKTRELPAEPRYAEYHFRSGSSGSSAALEHYNRAIELQRSGNLEGAISSYTRAIEIDKNNASAYNNRGVALMSRNEYLAAVADFTRSIELEPSEAAYNNRAGAHLSLKKFAEAIADFTSGIRLRPTPESYSNRGIAYELTGRFDLALLDHQSAIKLDPKFGRAYVLRGLIELRNRQDTEAQDDFDKAFQLDPNLHAEFDPLIAQLRARQKPN